MKGQMPIGFARTPEVPPSGSERRGPSLAPRDKGPMIWLSAANPGRLADCGPDRRPEGLSAHWSPAFSYGHSSFGA